MNIFTILKFIKTYKDILLLLIISLIIASCSKVFNNNINKQYVLERKSLVYSMKEYEGKYCFLSSEYDNTKDWLLATIYFPEYSYKLDKDKNISKIISNIVELHRKCTQRIAIIAHTSEFETNSIGMNSALELSLNRAYYIKSLLQKNKIANNYINIYFCVNTLNRYDEKINGAKLYNQKVDIVMLNSKEDQFSCLPNVNSNN